MDSLLNCPNPKILRDTLKALPSGADAYEQAYKKAVQRIKSQKSMLLKLALETISWIMCAKRHLTLGELQHALAIESHTEALDEDNLTEIDTIVSACAGLVIVDKQSNGIRLVHYTTQVYFERAQGEHFPDCHQRIAHACLTYISYDVFHSGICSTADMYNLRLKDHALYGYAATHWGDHVRDASLQSDQEVISFLNNDSKRIASFQAMEVSAGNVVESYQERFVNDGRSCQVAAWFNLIPTLEWLLNQGIDPDHTCKGGRTPLYIASRFGHVEIVRMLLSRGANVNAIGGICWYSLEVASFGGHLEIVRLLLGHGADINARGGWHGNALNAACRNGQMATAELLLEKGASISRATDGELVHCGSEHNRINMVQMFAAKRVDHEGKCNRCGTTPLMDAAGLEYPGLVTLLLRLGSDVESQDNLGNTALHYATLSGCPREARLLIEANANVNFKNKEGQTPLMKAAALGKTPIIKLLVERGASIQDQDRFKRTALHHAAEIGRPGAVQLLVSLGSDQTLLDHWKRTPLLCAEGRAVANQPHNHRPKVIEYLFNQRQLKHAKDGQDLYVASWLNRIGLVQKLLQSGADADAPGPLGPPLYVATLQGHIKVVQHLLDHGVSVDHTDTIDAKTPLIVASEQGFKGHVKILIAAGADVAKKDRDGQTALAYAAENGHCVVARMLLEAGATIQDVNRRCVESLLISASRHNFVQLVKPLIAAGADLSTKDRDGQTALAYAAEEGHCEIACILLEAGATVHDTTNRYTKTPLISASEGGYVELVELLIKVGAQVECQDKFGETALHYAAENGHLRVAEALIEAGASLSVSDSTERTPLRCAQQREHTEMIQYLTNYEESLWERLEPLIGD